MKMQFEIKKLLKFKGLLIVLLLITFLFVLISDGIKKYKKDETPEEKPTQPAFVITPENKVQRDNVVPGVTKYNDVDRTTFGNYFSERRIGDLEVTQFRKPETGARLHEVGITQDNVIEYLRIPIPYEEKVTLEGFLSSHGLENVKPDIDKYESTSEYAKIFVFLNKGVAITYQEYVIDGTPVKHATDAIYFKPMSEDQYFEYWGDTLGDEPFYHKHDWSMYSQTDNGY